MSHRRRRYCPRGTTYVEMTVCTLLVGLVLVAALDSAGSAARTTLGVSQEQQVQQYAARLMAEVLSVSYFDPEADDENENFGIESDEADPPSNRLAFDDIDDFDDWAESSALQARDGAADTNTSGWSRTVNVKKLAAASPYNQLADTAIDQGARLITVTVTAPSGVSSTLQAIRAIDGAMEQSGALDTTFVTGVGLQLTTTSAETRQRSAINNHASGP